jgi:4-amino-4-deoxy-L-arabinose transferase-like glycosyltransferase
MRSPTDQTRSPGALFPNRFDRFRADTVSTGWVALGATVVIGLVALLLRIASLSTLPSGLHGDEAIVGLEAERILSDGWIGLYSPHAAGQPALPLYLFAPFVWLFENTVLAVRILPALVGAATPVLTFLLLRRPLGPLPAFAAALLLASMVWHIHYSRIAFPIVFWPVAVLVAHWAVVRAFQTHDQRWWAVAGAAVAFGVYVYNAHWMFGAAIALAGLGFLAMEGRARLLPNIANAALAAGVAVLVLLPIIRLALDSDSVYTSHFQRDALIGSETWEAETGIGAKMSLLSHRYVDVWRWILGNSGVDNVDAAGVVPLVSIPLLVLAAWGVATGWRRDPFRWWWLVAVSVVLVMPLASVFTLEGVPRRPFAMSMPLVVLAGIAVADLQPRINNLHSHHQWRPVFAAGVTAFVLLASLPGIHGYFSEFPDDPSQRWVFVEDFTEDSRFMSEIPPHVQVFVASHRHSVNYETRQFLAPDLDAQDWDRSTTSLREESQRNPVLVLLLGHELAFRDAMLQAGARQVVSWETTGRRYAALCLGCSPATFAELQHAATN